MPKTVFSSCTLQCGRNWWITSTFSGSRMTPERSIRWPSGPQWPHTPGCHPWRLLCPPAPWGSRGSSIISSGVGRMLRSLLTDWFSFVRSTQILALTVFFFKTGNVGAHYSVGCVTRSMTPFFSIFCSSTFTFCNNRRGSWHAVCTACAAASSLNWILTGSAFRLPCLP